MAEATSSWTTAVDETHDAGFNLCANCRRLGLSVDKFVISKPTASRDVQPAPMVLPAGDKSQSNHHYALSSFGSSKKPFAQLVDLREKRALCRFCDLLCLVVEKYDPDSVKDPITLFLAWEVDGRQITGPNRHTNRTRRIRVTWTTHYGTEQYIYLVFVASKYSRMPNSDAAVANTTGVHFLARGLLDPRHRQALMMSWLTACSETHGAECQTKLGSSKEFNKLLKATYFGVIDVVDMNLKELPRKPDGELERYVALSYVWGTPLPGKRLYTSARSNVLLHIHHGGLEKAWDKMPRTIQDAIRLVNLLGERYLWIDSLCIVQDSVSSWELNAKAMHLVYGNAHFTICAADGDAETGLLAVEPILRATEPNIPGRPRRATTSPLTSECALGVRLLVSRPTEAVIQASLWNQRGWTFQERLLSRRCLIFAEGQVYFQCRSSVMSEDVFTDGTTSGWSLDWANSPLRTLDDLNRRAFWFYMKCVQLYTGRGLTKPKDILTAFQGASWLLEQRFNAPFLYGLPTSHFDLALLWRPLDAQQRRRERNSRPADVEVCSKDKLGNCNCKSEEQGYANQEFPSWSWCGWIGGKMEYQSEMIEGCLLDVQEWLRAHTWIRWYIRDHEGNLRPLWDKNVFQQDLSEEVRWRGYAGRRHKVDIAIHRVRHPSHPTRRTQRRNRRTTHLIPRSLDSSPTLSESADQPIPQPNFQYLRKLPKNGPAGAARQTGDKHWSRISNKHWLDRVGYWAPDDDGEEYAYGYGHIANDSFRPLIPHPGDGYPTPGYPTHVYPNHVRPTIGYPTPVYPTTSYPNPFGPMVMRPLRSYYVASGRAGPQPPIPAVETVIGDEDSDSDSESWKSAKENADEEESENDLESCTTDDHSDDISPNKFKSLRQDDKQTPVDAYGRVSRRDEDLSTGFTGIIPDNPFGVLRGPAPAERKDYSRAMPVLQFWTWRIDLYVRLSENESTDVAGFSRCDITDDTGDWCGSIVIPKTRATELQGGPQSFIAISDAKFFTHQECSVWNYYIPKERHESEWDLYYVLLLQRNHRRALWERVALGKVFQAAFGDADWNEIKLG